jgi:hypothetical protein
MAEIAIDRRAQRVFVGSDDPLESRDTGAPRLKRRIALFGECRPLEREQAIELLNRSAHRAGLYGAAPTLHSTRPSYQAVRAIAVGRKTAAVPAMISSAPATIGAVTVSSRNSTPQIMPSAGSRKVTVIARVGPTFAISRK